MRELRPSVIELRKLTQSRWALNIIGTKRSNNRPVFIVASINQSAAFSAFIILLIYNVSYEQNKPNDSKALTLVISFPGQT
jgi:hypothetical protein